MPYDDGLAHRIRRQLEDEPGLTGTELFGGLGFLLDGNLACGIIEDSLVVRVGPGAYEDALEEPHARPFDFTGRPMRGWPFVDPSGVSEDEALAAWLERCLTVVDSRSPK